MYTLSTKMFFERRTSFNFKSVIFLFVLSFLSFSQTYGQGTSCNQAEELCPANGVTYPATTGAAPAPPGNNYGCLGTQPNPAWFYIEIAQAGNINISLTNSNNVDIDFAMWGPFTSLPAALSNCGSLSAPSDCSYSPSSSETASIPSGTVGQIYILMITNFSNSPTEISGSATGSGVASCDGVCLADGGSLNQADLSGCTGDPDLNITINPSYTFPAVQPDILTYGYTFLVSNAAGTIIMTLDGPDMSTLPPGDYTICGLSYKLDDAALVSTAIGQTVAALQSSFDNQTALFCGDTSDDCFDITVGIPNPPILRDTTGCVGEFLILPDGSSCPAPGLCTYSVDIGTGCPQDITYIVEPLFPTTETIDATVCEGECVTIEGVDYCDVAQAITLENEAGCDSLVVLNISFIAVNAEIANPDMLSCTNQTVTLDGSASDGNAFEWYDESNTLVGTMNTLEVTTPGCYTLTAINNTANPPCTNQETVCVTQDGGGTPITPSPNGTTPVCAPGMGTYSVAPEAGTTYTWSVSGNGTIGSGQGTEEITVNWTSGGTTNVCVTASNTCGSGTQECFPVTINTAPADPMIIGDTPICPNGTGNYSVPFDATATSYNWTVPAGASIISGDNTESITVSFGSTAGDVCLIVSNLCGNATQDCFPVSLFELPADASVSGPTDICPGQTVTYTTPSDINTTVYNWNVPPCATIDSGQGSNSITVTWGVGCTAGGNVCVDVSNACGTGQGDCLPISLSTVTEMPMVSISQASVCDCDITTASVTDAATASDIVWTVPTGATIIAGQGTANVTIDWCNAQSGDVCATLTYACGTVSDCEAVTVETTPTANAGTDDSICGLTYDLNATASVGNGTWSYSGAGTANFLNASAAQTSVTVDDYGSYTFTWTENNNSCTDSDEVTIDFNASPTIDGGITETCNGTNTAYTISFNVTGGSLPYTATGITGTWAGSLFTSDEITSGSNYSFTISDANNCVSQTYNGVFTCDCETDAGTIQVEQLEACVDQTVTATHNGDENLDANDISQFILHNGDPIGGVIFASNNTGTFGLTPPMLAETTYYIAFAVGDDDGMGNVDLSAACAGFTEGIPIIFHDYPTPNAGADDAVCGLSYNVIAMPDAAGGSWSQTGGVGTAIFTDVNAPITTVTVSEFGTYTFTWSESNAGCLGDDSVDITFNPSPEITGGISEVCNGTNTAYTITFDVTGGSSPYMTSGITGTWTGDTFTSDEIASGTTYTFTITDANNCVSQDYNGIFTCDCETDAGTIQVEQLEACVDQTVTATHNGDETLDANDISQFILHDGDPIGGVIFASNNTGTFGLTPPMLAETIYYIAFAVGDDDGMGNVDLNAACSGFTEGIPIIFHEYPTPTAGANDAICGLTYELSANPDVAGGSWSQTGGTGTAIFNDANTANTTVTVSELGTYTFTWTEDNFGCVGSDAVEISFNESPAIDGLIDEVCNNTNTAYTISFTVTGGTAPYSTTGIAGTWATNVFTSEELASGANYTFTISDANNCASQDYTGAHICDCETDAGTMALDQLEACADQTVTATHNGDEVLDGDDVTQYLLHDGDAINGQIFDMNATGEFSLVAPMMTETTYFISLAVGNNDGNGNVDLTADCTDITQGQPVVFYAYPTPDAGMDDAICGLTYDLSATPVFAGGMWSSTDATVIFANAADANTSVTVTDFGTYIFTWTESNNGCEGSNEVEITFNAAPELAAPQVETCDLATNDYTVTFSITGGQAPYFVDGTMIAGTDFTSTPIGSNVTYSFEVTDANACGPITVTGSRNCDCQSDAGTMEQTLQEACIGATVTGLPLGDETNDGDDVIQYILHDGNGTVAGTIFGTGNTPTFGLVPPMTTGVTYYISTIIGNDLGGGIVDMNDPCFRIAVGTPVIFNPLPDGSISGDTQICEGGSADISFDLVGTPPFSVVFDGMTLTDQAATFTQTVSPVTTTDYSLTEVTDANGCVQTVNSTVTITVNTPPSATIDATANVCNSTDNGNSTTLNFSNFITAGDATGTWEDTGGSGAMGAFTNLDFTGVTPGNYTFTYTTAAANAPCTNVSYTMTIVVEDCVCPSVETSAPDALCNDGGNLDLTSLQVTDQAGTWAIVSQPVGASETLNGSNFATAGIPAGDYTFEFTLTNMPPDGCPSSSQETLTVNQSVSAGTSNAALNFCEANATNVNLNDEITGADAGGTWTEISANPSTGSAFNANTGTFNPSGQSVGTYTFRYTVSGLAPCGDDSSEVNVTISPVPVADAGETDEITCDKEEVNLGGDSTQGSNISYLWEATDGGVINPDEVNSLNPTALSGGTYTLIVTNDLTGCSDTDVVVITEAVELPMPFFSISDISCFGESDGLITIDSVAGGQEPYTYSLDGENFSTTTFFPGLSGGDYTISVQDANGCLNAISFNFPEPTEMAVELFAVLEDDNTIRFGDSVALNLTFEADVAFDSLDNVIWTPSEVLSCDTCQMTWAMPFETTNFSVTIEEDGCSATDNLTLVVRRDAPIFVPNAFSPNNDGENEVLMIFAGDQVAKVNAFLVYDRWGEVVHEYYQFFPNDPAFGWDGTWRGEPMNPAVFAWYAEVELIDGRVEILKGDVTLVR